MLTEVVGPEQIADIVSKWTGIPVTKLGQVLLLNYIKLKFIYTSHYYINITLHIHCIKRGLHYSIFTAIYIFSYHPMCFTPHTQTHKL